LEQGIEICFLARTPWRLWFGPGVRAISHDVGDHIAELGPYLSQGRGTTLIFCGIMQEASDGLIFVAPVFHDECRSRHQMGDVRDSSPFAYLVLVKLMGVPKGVIEASGQHDLVSLVGVAHITPPP
jgi:hypothetical protein